MRRFGAMLFILAMAGLCGAGESTVAPEPGVQGNWESKFRAIPDPLRIRESDRLLSAHPHHVGSVGDKKNAEWIRDRFREWGWQVEIETFQVLFPTPKERVLEMIEPTRLRLSLHEPAVPEDPCTGQPDELPTYNAYSIDGDATGPLVYVNYGMPEDYEELAKTGVDVKGAIVLVRYGGGWRGIKPKVAAEHGAIGCLIYSDPADDGYRNGDVFPKGPMRPSGGVQRGSVNDGMLYSGDPLTPGVAAKSAPPSFAIDKVPTLTRIPVQPISYGDAQPLLAAMRGPLAPDQWRGGLPIPYRIGPGPAKVRLKLSFNWDIKPVYDVIARIPGSLWPDQWVIRGNHHDAWVYGAEDPLSGLSAMLEEARAFGELLKQGWRPKRTIVYAAWDGEEPGLLGSTEWVEAHVDELRRGGVAYINSDGVGRGLPYLGGTESLEGFMNEVLKAIDDPEKGISVWERSHRASIGGAETTEARKEARERAFVRMDSLGAGSDHTAFWAHAGIPAVGIGFGGEDDGGIYHSIYDDFYWFTHFSDTDFRYGRTLAQTAGTAVFRLAYADALPFDAKTLAGRIREYADDCKALLKKRREEAEEKNRSIDEGIWDAMSDPKNPTVAPPRADVPPFLDFAPLDNAMAALDRSVAHYEKVSAGISKLTPQQLDPVNQAILHVTQSLCDSAGLPGRPWYQCLIVAPGLYTGYVSKTLPGVREAIELGHWKEAETEATRVAAAIERAAKVIEEAAALVEKPKV